MSKHAAKTVRLRDMEAIVRVAETTAPADTALHLKGVPLLDGTVSRVYVAFERDVIYVERPGHLTRIVKVADLAAAILEATE